MFPLSFTGRASSHDSRLSGSSRYKRQRRDITICVTRLASNEIFSPSNKILREVGWARDLSAPRYLHTSCIYYLPSYWQLLYLFLCLFCQVVILEHKSIICAGYSAVMHIHCAAEEVTVKVSIIRTAGIVLAFLCPFRKSTHDLQESPFLSITLFRLFTIITVQAKVLNVYPTGLVIEL